VQITREGPARAHGMLIPVWRNGYVDLLGSDVDARHSAEARRVSLAAVDRRAWGLQSWARADRSYLAAALAWAWRFWFAQANAKPRTENVLF
jgi:hypothetical protein